MEEAKKLEKLIELAWTNGYEKLKEWRACEDFEITNWGLKKGCYEDTETTDKEYIIFDHDFIKALCRAIHDKGDFCCGLDTHRDDVLKELAISTDRIDYLYKTFIGE